VATKRKKRLTFTRDPERPVSERGETLYTIREAADYLGVKDRWMKTAVARRYIPFIRVGGMYIKFRKADLDAYIEAQTVPAREQR
jgi:excisionase family DNA binding protein